MTGLVTPGGLLSGAQSLARVGDGVIGIQTLLESIEQMNSPGVGVAMFNCGKQIAVARPGVDTGEHGLRAMENFVVQADANWRQVDAAVDGAGLPRCRLMNIVDGALADAHAQQVAHQFHHATIRAVTDEGQTQRQLAQPRLGNGQLE